MPATEHAVDERERSHDVSGGFEEHARAAVPVLRDDWFTPGRSPAREGRAEVEHYAERTARAGWRQVRDEELGEGRARRHAMIDRVSETSAVLAIANEALHALRVRHQDVDGPAVGDAIVKRVAADRRVLIASETGGGGRIVRAPVQTEAPEADRRRQ